MSLSDFYNTEQGFRIRLDSILIEICNELETRKMKIDLPLKGFLTVVITALLTATALSQDAKPKIDDLQWMAGCWELSVPQRNMTIAEHWMKPAGGTLIGMGRTVVGGKTVSWEALRVVAGDAGIDYIAKPSSSKEETEFRLVKWSATEAIFENPEHDFPQRIIYRKGSSEELFARIEGNRNGKVSGMDIPMKRAACG